MIEALFLLVSLIRSTVKNQTELALENLALRQQLAILNRKGPRRRMRQKDRLFWACLSRVWQRWRECLIVVKPGDGRPVASERVCAVLEAPFKTQKRCRPARNRQRYPRFDPQNGSVKSHLGTSESTRGTAKTGDQDLNGLRPG